MMKPLVNASEKTVQFIIRRLFGIEVGTKDPSYTYHTKTELYKAELYKTELQASGQFVAEYTVWCFSGRV